MASNEWIGIQFNFKEKQEFKKWIENFDSLNLKADEEHVRITIPSKRFDKDKAEIEKSEIIEFSIKTLKRFLEYSDYTTCYGYIEDVSLDRKLPNIKNDFNESNEINVYPSIRNKNLLQDFPMLNDDVGISQIIENKNLYLHLNSIRKIILSSNINPENQNLFVSIEYMDKLEEGNELNILRMDVKFEEK